MAKRIFDKGDSVLTIFPSGFFSTDQSAPALARRPDTCCADSHPADERPEPAFTAALFPQLAPVQLRLTACCGALQTPIREDDCWQGFKTCLQNPIYSISWYVFFCKVPNGPPPVDCFVKIHAICLLWQAQKFHRLFFWFYEFNQSGKNFVEYCFSI